MNHPPTPDNQSGYGTGVVLGALLGGVSLLLFGTKTGRKIHQQLSDEFAEGNFDFRQLQEKTNHHLEHFLATTQVTDFFKQISTNLQAKISPKSPPKAKKNFFFKRGKKLG